MHRLLVSVCVAPGRRGEQDRWPLPLGRTWLSREDLLDIRHPPQPGIHIHTQMHMHSHIHTCISTHTYVHASMPTHTQTHAHTLMHPPTHIVDVT